MPILEGRAIVTKSATSGNRAGSSAPLTLALHGAGSSPKGFSRKLPVAAPGVIGVYPAGTAAAPGMEDYLVWNAGLCCGMPAMKKMDDVGFVARAVEVMLKNLGLPSDTRIDLVGHSNGAMMALRFACERPDMVHRVVVTAGALVSPCASSKGVSFLLIHGTNDRAVPFNGGKSANGRTDIDFPSMAETADRIRAGGGHVETIALQGAGHHVFSIDKALRTTRGKGLYQVTRDWLAGD